MELFEQRQRTENLGEMPAHGGFGAVRVVRFHGIEDGGVLLDQSREGRVACGMLR